MIALTPRQRIIASFVPPCDCAADIGCDHGRLGAYLLQAGTVIKIIASDISRPSLEKAERLALRLGLQDKFKFRCGDGLNVLAEGEAQCVIIAGMGGGTIADMLIEAPMMLNAVIVQPMNGISVLKSSLKRCGYILADEKIAVEGRRFYEIALLKPGEGSLSENETLLPMHAIRRKDAVCSVYLQKKLEILRLAAEKTVNNIDVCRKINIYSEVLEWLK